LLKATQHTQKSMLGKLQKSIQKTVIKNKSLNILRLLFGGMGMYIPINYPEQAKCPAIAGHLL
jgi:hypothetical protein